VVDQDQLLIQYFPWIHDTNTATLSHLLVTINTLSSSNKKMNTPPAPTTNANIDAVGATTTAASLINDMIEETKKLAEDRATELKGLEDDLLKEKNAHKNSKARHRAAEQLRLSKAAPWDAANKKLQEGKESAETKILHWQKIIERLIITSARTIWCWEFSRSISRLSSPTGRTGRR
jgi:hypothetical protein